MKNVRASFSTTGIVLKCFINVRKEEKKKKSIFQVNEEKTHKKAKLPTSPYCNLHLWKS
jgi:hypothetical protein